MSEIINYLEMYDRIIEGKPYGKNFKPYPKKIIKKAIQFFSDEDEFEKCIELEKFIEKRFNHEENYSKIF